MSYAMPNINTIAEVQGYPKEILHKTGFQATRRVRVTWDTRYDWASWFFYTPAANNYPYFVDAGLPTSSAITKIGIEPDESSRIGNYESTNPTYGRAGATYGYALMTLVYESVGFNDTDLLIEELQPYLDSKYIGGGKLYFANGTAAGNSSMLLPGYVYSVTYPRLTYPKTWDYATGMINLDAFQLRMFPRTILPFCGLAAGGEMKAVIHYDGTQRFSQTNNVFVRGADWNMDWCPSAGAWGYLYTATGAQISKYAMTVFNGLL